MMTSDGSRRGSAKEGSEGGKIKGPWTLEVLVS